LRGNAESGHKDQADCTMHDQRVTHCWREWCPDWYCFDIQEA
jgi:hypothetical protein